MSGTSTDTSAGFGVFMITVGSWSSLCSRCNRCAIAGLTVITRSASLMYSRSWLAQAAIERRVRAPYRDRPATYSCASYTTLRSLPRSFARPAARVATPITCMSCACTTSGSRRSIRSPNAISRSSASGCSLRHGAGQPSRWITPSYARQPNLNGPSAVLPTPLRTQVAFFAPCQRDRRSSRVATPSLNLTGLPLPALARAIACPESAFSSFSSAWIRWLRATYVDRYLYPTNGGRQSRRAVRLRFRSSRRENGTATRTISAPSSSSLDGRPLSETPSTVTSAPVSASAAASLRTLLSLVTSLATIITTRRSAVVTG